MAEKHPNSKKISIFRSGSFIEQAQTGAEEFMSLSKKSIGSYYKTHMSKSPGSDLSFEEVDVLMPLVIDIPKEDRTFRKAVTDYFDCVCTVIPYGTGVTLEIGLEVDNSKPITFVDDKGKRNLPIKIDEYIRYRHAKGHPQVAQSKKEAQGSMLKAFYIFDAEAVESEEVNQTKLKDTAMATYLSIKDDEKKVDMMLTLLLVDPRTFHGKGAFERKVDHLRSLVDKSAVKFEDIFKDKHFDSLYVVQTMINTNVLRKIGEQFVDAETGESIGHNTEEAVYWLVDKKNSEKVSILKAKMQEGLKQELAAGAGPNSAKKKPTTARA